MADNQQYGPLTPKQTSASDIRSVIANATKQTGKGMTIATKEEINDKKAVENKKETVSKVANKESKADTKKTTSTNTKTITPKTSTPVTVKKTDTNNSGINKFASLTQQQVSGDLFKNPALQPINNVKIIPQSGEQAHESAPKQEEVKSDIFINKNTVFPELKAQIDIDNPIMDLYSDIKKKYQKGTLSQLNEENVLQLKQLPRYSALSNVDDNSILQLVGSMASMVKSGVKLDDNAIKLLKQRIPALSSAEWGFNTESGENMYQAGGFREQMAGASKSDLNRYGVGGAVAEGVMNPLGEATTLLDMGAQQIGQFDNNNSRSEKLKKALQTIVSNEKLLNQYKEAYSNLVKDDGIRGWLSNLYTQQVEGDTVVEQVWNMLRGNTKKDVDAGFRNWLIHTVNNRVNGYMGELMGDANELTGVSGPNVAKMYANAPASAIKTATAVARAITNPIDTATGLYGLFFTEEGHQALASRYGSWDAFAKALEQDPVGVSSDALAIIEGGAGATKLVAGTASKAGLISALATETLGATRASEGLLKIASRLEYLQSKAGAIEKTAGLASNLGVDIPLKGGMVNTKPIQGLINGLKEWGEQGENIIQKVAKYSADASERGVGKILSEAKDVIKEGPIDTLANKLMGTASASDKLFKASSPNINRLANNVDYKNKRANMDIATQAIVDAGYTPKSISEWAKAHTETLNKKWNEFKQLVKDKGDTLIDVKDILEDVKNYIKSEREGATELQKQDLRKLEVEVNALERMGKVDMNFVEKRKEHYNSSWRDSDKLKVGDVYLKGIKMIGNAMRKQQDNILGKGPESTKKLRKEIGALMDTKNDVIKADVKNQKKKSDISGGGLVESYGRLSGLGDIIGGTLSTLTKGGEGLAQAGKGVGKLVLGKAMGRAKDVDFLTKKGFEGLSKKKASKTAGEVRSKFQDSRDLGKLLLERDELKKELKNDKISAEDKKKLEKRLDDVEYAIAQKKARNGLGDKENKLDAESKKKVIDMVQKRAKDVGFTTEVLDGMEKDTQGYTDLQKKLIALEKNPGDTTAQHELFHAFFSVVDNKTKTYILDEAKKILKDAGMADKNAEEWLAESFGIYAKRQQIKLGNITAPKGFVNKVRDFFQKVYEFMQRFNGDRATINKLFDEVLGDRQMKNGIMDLSDLLGNKEVKERKLYAEDNGLRKKSVYHGSPADFDKFDSSHMGEGEGNQAHGWGHYVAVDEKTGRRYADMKNPTNYEYKGRGLKDIEKELWDSKPGEKIELIPIRQMLDSDWMGRYQKGERFDIIKNEGLKDAKKSLNYSKRIYEENPKGKGVELTYKERYEIDKRLYDAWNNLDKKDFDFEKPYRNLYNLDIPDPVKKDTPTGSNYLEEGGKLTESELNKFKEIFKEIGINMLPEKFDDFGVKMMDYSGKNGKTLYRFLERALGSDKKASQFLEKLGYDGIHYYGGRDGEAYVIFNDDALQIKDHIRYKKKIGDKEVEITPKVKSPDELIEKNADGLSVMKSFISDKQAEKALNVNKALLDKDGNPYLWTHTNKYDAPQFANFENTKDSKYKEFGDYEIAWFSNSEDMSRSYANQESKLADTKPINSIEEFNDRFSKYDIDGTPYNTEWKKGDGKEWKYGHKTSIDKEGNEYVLNQYDSESHKYKDLETLYNEWNNGGYDGQSEKEVIDGIKKLVHEEFIDSPDFRLYDDVDIKKEKDGYVLTTSSKKELGRYKSEQEALAKSTAKKHVSGKYHYQGIITDIKNPLVVDLGKYKPGEIKNFRDGARMMGEHGRYWSDLGNAYEFVKKEQPNVDEIFSKVEKEWKGAKDSSRRIIKNAFDIEREADNLYKAYKGMEEGPAKKFAEDRLMLYRDAGDKIGYIGKGVVDELKPEQRNLRVEVMNEDLKGSRTTTIGELYDEAIADYKKYKDVYDVFGEGNRLWKESGKYSQPEGYDKSKTKNFINLLKKNGMSEGAISILHGTDLMNRIDLTYNPLSQEGWAITKLKDKSLQTNDYVFYALRKGGYDGVIFKDIIDYGGKGDNKGGDVLATFKSKNFKAWDNANPTDSKYISYKKKVGLDSKGKGLEKKSESNGLLAKGRQRDSGIRFKKDIPEDKKLIGLHNLSIDKLKGAIELGGLPMPSIAVTKKGVPHESYGGLTFIMKESAINPKKNSKNRLYTVDGYTPVQPHVKIRPRKGKEVDAIIDNIEKKTGLSYGEVMQWLEYKDSWEERYPELKKFDKEYNQITEKKLFGGYDRNGNPKYIDYNLKNIVKKMVENKRDAFNGAFWKMVAQSEGTTTVDKLREKNYGLKDKEASEKIAENYYHGVADLYEKVGGNTEVSSLSDYGRFAEEISDSYRPTTDAWWKELTQWDGAEGTIYSKITKEDLQKLQDIVKEGVNQPRPYSEAKPERAIRFDEVGAVVAPEGKLKEVKDILKDTGLKVYGYKEGERMSVVDKVADDNGLRFKKKVDQTQTPEFKKWFEGSKVVDKSGKPLVAYHGTHGDFNIFDKEKIGSNTNNEGLFGKGFYFTTDSKYGDYYKGKGWSKDRLEGKTMQVYLDIKNPFMWNDYKGPQAIEKLRKELKLPKSVLEWNNYGDNGIHVFTKPEQSRRFTEALEKAGYDGVWFKYDNGTQDEIVAFNPNQIKSATDNIGTFDKNNPDIRYKKNSEGKDLSEGQIKYFADSKARNDKGELLVVYRGTKNIEGDRFLYSKDHQTGEDFGKAYYFTTNKDQARGYSFDDTKTQAYKDWWKKRHEYHDKYLETKDEKYKKLRDEWSDKNGLHLRDVNEMDKHPEGFGETRAYYLNIKNPLEYDAQGKTWGVYEKLFKEFKEDRKWRGAEYGYDGIIIHNVKDNSVKRNGEFEDMDVYITFNQNQAKYTDNLNPTTKLSKRFKKNVGLEKKADGLEKKKTSSLGRNRSEIDNFAEQLGIKGGTELEKMKKMNKIIKDPKYQGTKIKKELYDLKWQIKKDYIIDNNKTIKDKGFKKTTLRVWQNGKKADWHFTRKQYNELKELGYIKK